MAHFSPCFLLRVAAVVLAPLLQLEQLVEMVDLVVGLEGITLGAVVQL